MYRLDIILCRSCEFSFKNLLQLWI